MNSRFSCHLQLLHSRRTRFSRRTFRKDLFLNLLAATYSLRHKPLACIQTGDQKLTTQVSLRQRAVVKERYVRKSVPWSPSEMRPISCSLFTSAYNERASRWHFFFISPFSHKFIKFIISHTPLLISHFAVKKKTKINKREVKAVSVRAVFKWLSKSQCQSIYPDQSQQVQTERLTNHNYWQFPETQSAAKVARTSAIGFGFAFHELKKSHEIFKPITKRRNRNRMITFADSYFKIALSCCVTKYVQRHCLF